MPADLSASVSAGPASGPRVALVAVVPVPKGTDRTADSAGWTGADKARGDALSTTDADLAARLVDLGYCRPA